jgi:hypothetical protein
VMPNVPGRRAHRLHLPTTPMSMRTIVDWDWDVHGRSDCPPPSDPGLLPSRE